MVALLDELIVRGVAIPDPPPEYVNVTDKLDVVVLRNTLNAPGATLLPGNVSVSALNPVFVM
jgi:hypothetical protein